MTEIEAFFKEIDALWAPAKEKRLVLKVIGSGALFLQTDYRRGTKDGDVLETVALTADLKKSLLELAGKGTPLSKRTGLYLDIVISGLPFLPHAPGFHPQARLNATLRHFRIEALDVVDVVVTKFKRFKATDLEDIRAMIDRGLVPHKRLVERFRSAIDDFSVDARIEDVPRVVKNLNQVERDLFRVPESTFDLPGWA